MPSTCISQRLNSLRVSGTASSSSFVDFGEKCQDCCAEYCFEYGGREGKEGHCQATPLSPVNGPFIFRRITQMPYCWLNNAKYSPNKDGIVTVFFPLFFELCKCRKKRDFGRKQSGLQLLSGERIVLQSPTQQFLYTFGRARKGVFVINFLSFAPISQCKKCFLASLSVYIFKCNIYICFKSFSW